MARTIPVSAKCPSCGCEIYIRKDGRLFKHGPSWDKPCPGSGTRCDPESETAKQPA